MEVFSAIQTVAGYVKKLVDLIVESNGHEDDLARGLSSMMYYLDLLTDLSKQLQLKSSMQLRLQELAFDIDDFIHGLWVPGNFGSFVLARIWADNRPGYILQTKCFQDRIMVLRQDLQQPNIESTPRGGTPTPEPEPEPEGSPIPYAQEVDLVGIEGPKKEIVELLSQHADPHHRGIGVISMVGCRGSGKTALARALYEDDAVAKDFDYKAWVVASDPWSVDKILQQVVPASAPESISQALQQFINKILRVLRLRASARGILQLLRRLAPARWSTSESFQDFPKNKRYMIFLDDVQRGQSWKDIKIAFRENIMDSRIIVTTSDLTVARACSSGSYMYTMQHLDKEKSRRLFRVKFREEDGYSSEDEDGLDDNDIDIIINKCDGLPMAVIGAAKYLHLKEPNPTREDFEKVSRDLGDCLACQNRTESTFAEMRKACVEPYENLLKHGQKECLLYVSLFSHGHQTNSKSLVRRLIAEGLVSSDDADMIKPSESVVGDVRGCLKKLMDHCMIEPVPIRNYYNAAKSCRVHSIMLEFTINKAVSRNFVSLIHKDQHLHNGEGKVRRLTVQSRPDVRETPEGMDLSVVRSVAIFKSAILYLEKCKLLRVLNLEGCCGLTERDFDNICGLLFLKYLSLRNTNVQKLPENVKNLLCLETLDTRDTVVIKLPVEVIMLPRFAYLFGQFELTNVHRRNTNKLTDIFEGNKSQLHTLGGIVVHDAEGQEIVLRVIQHAKKLKKVKVWYRDTPSNTGPVTNSTAVPEPIRGATGPGPIRLWNKLLNCIPIGRRRASAGPSADPDPALATSTPLAYDTPELVHCVERLTETLKNRCTNCTDSSMELHSLSIDLNGVANNCLDFLQTNGTIGSIKLRRGFVSLPGTLELGRVKNLKKLHLFLTGLKSEQLASLQHLKCLKYLKLAEDSHELWDSVFHVKAGGFISLIWLCFESSNSKPPPLKIDGGVKTPLKSLLLLCKESHPRVQGMSHLVKLNEVILHPSATDDEVTAWKEEAKKHINWPHVEKKKD